MDIKPFMTRFGFSHRESKHIVVEQKDMLWLAFASEGAGMFMMSTDSIAAGLLEISTLYGGEAIPYTYTATESLVVLTTEKGEVRIAVDAEARALRIEGGGITLRLDSKNSPQSATSLNTESGVILSMGGGRYFFAPKKGTITFDDSWMLSSFRSVPPVLEIAPADGSFELVAYDMPEDGGTPPVTKTVDECAAENAADFAKFRDTLAAVPAEWNDLRDKIAYILWHSSRKTADGTDIFVANKLLTSASDALSLSLASFLFDDATRAASLITAVTSDAPQAQAFAVIRLFEKGLFKKVSRKTVFQLYESLNSHAVWWSKNRLSNNFKYYFYAYRYEAGAPANSLFKAGPPPVASPDINAYMILVFDALALLSDHLGIGADSAKWRERSAEQMKTLMTLWDGDKFNGKYVHTGKTAEADGLISVMPVILGDKLPSAAAEKLAEKIGEDVLGHSLGALALFGLNKAGYAEQAKRIVTAALNAARESGVTDTLKGAVLLALAHEML